METQMDTDVPHGSRQSKEQTDALVVQTITANADSLLRLARRYSVCPDDAADAYQRGLEIFLRHVARLDPDRAAAWLHQVVKHEALAVRRSRGDVAPEHLAEPDDRESDQPSPEERVLRLERVQRAADALGRLKPGEVEALWHRALGKSYDEIASDLGLTHRQVNRRISEGRRALIERMTGMETGAECAAWAPVMSAMVDGEASSQDVLSLRPHLRHCGGCRATLREMRSADASVAALLPPAGLAAAAASSPDSGLLSRLYESLVTFAADKTATSALKVQALLDAVGGGKVAAVAASAAAVAGGGAAVAEHVSQRPAPRPSAVRPAVAPVGSPGRAAVTSAPARRTTTDVTHTTAPRRHTTEFRRTRRRSEFEPKARTATTTAAEATSPATTSPESAVQRGGTPSGGSGSGAEFGF